MNYVKEKQRCNGRRYGIPQEERAKMAITLHVWILIATEC